MKKIFYVYVFVFIFLIVDVTIIYFKDDLKQVYRNMMKSINHVEELEVQNEYYRNYDFDFVQDTTDNSPSNYQELLNVIYSTLNRGYSDFSFYCDDKYLTCIDDVISIADNSEILSTINNYVHPFNSFDKIKFAYNNDKLVNLEILHNYDEEDIAAINDKVDTIFNTYYNPSDTIYNNIQVFHDYIINNTDYDSERIDNQVINYKSDQAYGPLLQGYAICSGYSDAMELFLEKLNVKSFKVASTIHVWNAVYYNNTWNHVDLTWDDPVMSNGDRVCDHNYYLIDTTTLYSQDVSQHVFKKELYKDFN